MKDIHNDELEFVYYKMGTAGSFRTGLYDLFWKADMRNQMKLEAAFPELWVLRKYTTESGYWEGLQQRYKNYRENVVDQNNY
jgi:hypothetical protein